MSGWKRRKSFWPALTILMIWLFVAGGFTWQRSRQSVVPPVWDQQTYVQKAEAVWSGLLKKSGENPLNIQPSSRPPGTVLLTAPLGPLRDFRNFYFRSTFVPVAIMVLAVFIAGIGIDRCGWPSAFVALLAGSMPMFWQFEIGENQTGYNWGLMDTFLTCLASLAMTGLLISGVRFKTIWLGLALVPLALLPLVKPSGFVVAALISMAWLGVAFPLASQHPRGRSHGRRKVVTTAIAIMLVLGGVALASFRSDYFSPVNIAFGNIALQQLRSEWFSTDTLAGFVSLFTGSIGTPLLVAFTTLGGMALLRRGRERDRTSESEALWMATVGIVVLLAGIILTYQATLFRQARYLYPVIGVVFVLSTPILVDWSKRAGPLICSAIAVIPMALLVYLTSPKLNGIAYKLGGYGLITGYGQEELRTATSFINSYRKLHSAPPVLFSTTDGIGTAAFEAAYTGHLRKLGYSDAEANQLINRPYNWETGGLVKIDSIYNADILALDALRSPRPMATKATPPEAPQLTFGDELVAWKQWLATTPAKGSTEVLLRSPGFVVLAVKNRSALEMQMRNFMASRPWRSEFNAANTRSEFTTAEVSTLQLSGQQLRQPVIFGKSIRVHALALTNVMESPNVDVAIYSEQLAVDPDQHYSLFIHQLDARGHMIANHDVPLGSSRFPDRPVSLERYSFHLLPATTQLGFGVYKPGGESLITDCTLSKDWGGRRAVINIGSINRVNSLAGRQ